MFKLLGGVAICVGAATAQADPEFDMSAPRVAPVPAAQAAHGVWLELGDSYAHVIATGNRFSTQAGSFAPYIALSRMFYAGAEITAGTITATGVVPSYGVDVAEALSGDVVSVRAIGGARAFLGPVSGAGELAFGAQDALVNARGVQSPIENARELFGVRGRIDYWPTSWFTVGATAGIDLLEPGDFSVGLGVGVHFVRYDGTRR